MFDYYTTCHTCGGQELEESRINDPDTITVMLTSGILAGAR